MATINLPLKKRAAKINSPSTIILFSQPKAGKTIAVADLPKCLIIDFEKGAHAIDAMSVDVTSITHLQQVCDAVKTNGYPYSYIALDTISALEEMCIKEAERRYSLTTEGINWYLTNKDGTLHPESGKFQLGSIFNLGFGKGYTLVGDCYAEVLEMVKRCAPKVILLAHSTLTTTKKKGKEVQSLDLMLGKKARFISTFKADAIGHIYRKDGKNYVNFTATDDVNAGGRFRYLEKEHVLLSEYVTDKQGNEKFITHWDTIFAPQVKSTEAK
jgi:hypothetical protein